MIPWIFGSTKGKMAGRGMVLLLLIRWEMKSSLLLGPVYVLIFLNNLSNSAIENSEILSIYLVKNKQVLHPLT